MNPLIGKNDNNIYVDNLDVVPEGYRFDNKKCSDFRFKVSKFENKEYYKADEGLFLDPTLEQKVDVYTTRFIFAKKFITDQPKINPLVNAYFALAELCIKEEEASPYPKATECREKTIGASKMEAKIKDKAYLLLGRIHQHAFQKGEESLIFYKKVNNFKSFMEQRKVHLKLGNQQKADICLNLAATYAGDDAKDNYRLAVIYKGIDDKENREKAITYFKKSIESLDKICKSLQKTDNILVTRRYLECYAEANYQLGDIYQQMGDEDNIKKAIACFEKAIRSSNHICPSFLGDLYQYNNHARSIEKAIDYYKKGIPSEEDLSTARLRCLYALAEIHYASVQYQDYTKAFRFFSEINKRGSNEYQLKSLHHLGCMCLEGKGTVWPPKKALEYFLLAAAEKHVRSLVMLGICYYRGELGLEKNYEEAFKYFTQSEKTPNSNISELFLAQMYEKGLGVEQDISKAIDYYEKIGGVAGYKAIGHIYNRGQNEIKQNFLKAFKYYKQAIDSKKKGDNLEEPFMGLAALYETGKGVEKDLQRAIFYYEKANSPKGYNRIGEIYQNENHTDPKAWIQTAITYFKKALVLPDRNYFSGIAEDTEKEDKEGRIRALCNLAKLYEEKGDQIKCTELPLTIALNYYKIAAEEGSEQAKECLRNWQRLFVLENLSINEILKDEVEKSEEVVHLEKELQSTQEKVSSLIKEKEELKLERRNEKSKTLSLEEDNKQLQQRNIKIEKENQKLRKEIEKLKALSLPSISKDEPIEDKQKMTQSTEQLKAAIEKYLDKLDKLDKLDQRDPLSSDKVDLKKIRTNLNKFVASKNSGASAKLMASCGLEVVAEKGSHKQLRFKLPNGSNLQGACSTLAGHGESEVLSKSAYKEKLRVILTAIKQLYKQQKNNQQNKT